MAPPPKDLAKLIALVQTTQSLLTHFSTSLAPTPTSSSSTTTTTTTKTTPPPPSLSTPQDLPTGPLPAISAATTLLKSHSTTLSLLLLTPPLTPSALIAKISDVTSGPLTGIVAAASYDPQPDQPDALGRVVRAELRTQVRRVVGAWGDVLGVVLSMAGARKAGDTATATGQGPTEAERKEVLARTGVLWDVCDVLVKVCAEGVVGVVVKKAQQLRAVLLDAVEEMQEWGEDVADEDEDEDDAVGSGDEDEDDDDDDDDFFSAGNKLRKSDVELKALLGRSVKKLKMVGIMYQAVGKRRLSTFPSTTTSSATPAKPTTTTTTNANTSTSTEINTPPTTSPPSTRLDTLLTHLTTLPSLADDLASTFYDLDHPAATAGLTALCAEAKRAVAVVERDWNGGEDEFTVWVGKWRGVLDAA